MSKAKLVTKDPDGPAGPVTVVLEGDLSVRGIAQIHREILGSMDRSGQVALEFRAIRETDATLFQLLCSAQRTAECSPGKELTLRGTPPPALRRFAAESILCGKCGPQEISSFWEGR